MRKIALMAMAVVAICGVALAAASYSVISLPAPGEWSPTGIGVGKLAYVQVEGAYPTNSTFVLSRISADDSVTNTLLTRTDVNGVIDAPIGTGTNIWIMAGDRLLRSGTITNTCRCRIILDGGN